jgi:hypothetical protein
VKNVLCGRQDLVQPPNECAGRDTGHPSHSYVLTWPHELVNGTEPNDANIEAQRIHQPQYDLFQTSGRADSGESVA